MSKIERSQFENLPYREVFEINDNVAVSVNDKIKVALIHLSSNKVDPHAQLLLTLPADLNIAREAIWDPQKVNLKLAGKKPVISSNLTLGFHVGERAFIGNGDVLSVVDILSTDKPSVILSYQSMSTIKLEQLPDESRQEKPFVLVWQKDNQKIEIVILASDERWVNRVINKYIIMKEWSLISINEASFSESFALLYRQYRSGKKIPKLLVDYFGLDMLKASKRSINSNLVIGGKAARVQIRPI